MWVGSRCPDERPHFFIGSPPSKGGCVLRCVKCKQHKWLPITFRDAANFATDAKRYGVQKAYLRMLDQNWEAKVLIAKLQHLWIVRRDTTDDEQFIQLAVAVMGDKEYDSIPSAASSSPSSKQHHHVAGK